jgi:bifunctional DNase/RNase
VIDPSRADPAEDDEGVAAAADGAAGEEQLLEQDAGRGDAGLEGELRMLDAEEMTAELMTAERVSAERVTGEPVARAASLEPASPLDFVDVVVALPSSYPVVILREVDWPERELHIPVGMAEGVAIGYAARHIPTPKPLTHELFNDVLVAFGLSVDVVRITDVAGRAYYAELVVSGPGGNRVLPCRPSDGICLALRSLLPVPITATSRVLDTAGVERG